MKKGCVFVIIGVFLFLLVGYLALRVTATYWVRGLYSENELKEMNRFFSTEVDFPAKWYEAKVYPKELLDSVQLVMELYRDLDVENLSSDYIKKLEERKELSPTEWNVATKYLEQVQPFIQKLFDLEQREDYEFCAWTHWLKTQENEQAAFTPIKNSLNVLKLSAYIYGKKQEWEEAFKANSTLMRLLRRPKNCSVLEHLFAYTLEDQALNCTTFLASQCYEQSYLQKVLSFLKTMDQSLHKDLMDQALALETINILREAKEDDIEISLEPGKSGRFYFHQMLAHLARTQPDDQDALVVDEVDQTKGLDYLKLLGFGWHFDAIMYKIYRGSFADSATKELIATAKYRLAKVSIASRLYKLENGSYPTKARMLVPVYFEMEPTDPFAKVQSNPSFRFDNRGKQFYSIGPDQKDNGNQFQIYEREERLKGDITPLLY